MGMVLVAGGKVAVFDLNFILRDLLQSCLCRNKACNPQWRQRGQSGLGLKIIVAGTGLDNPFQIL